jgi:hypothetical protein
MHDLSSVYYRYYSATIIQMTGVRDQSTAIWLAAVTGLIHDFFLFTIGTKQKTNHALSIIIMCLTPSLAYWGMKFTSNKLQRSIWCILSNDITI